MPEEGAEDLGNGPDELTVGQVENQVSAEALPQKEGALLGAGGAEKRAPARERAEEIVAAVGTADAGDAWLQSPQKRNAEAA